MDITAVGRKLTEIIKKYRYVILVILIGIGLMLLPVGGEKKTQVTQTPVVQADTDITQELAQILTQIRGAGKVQVFLSRSAGEKTIYQSDADTTTSPDGGTKRQETVIVTDGDRAEQPLVQQILPPEYKGAIVVCQGADDASVRLAIVEAVANATGLGTDRISVLKMK